MIAALGLADRVTFVTEAAIEFMRSTQDKYDLVFLDGDHSGRAVYREIAASLRLLREGGVILLHDYFPNDEPLWSDGRVTPGPRAAIKRLQRECKGMDVIPLGDLPWPIKQGTNTTSLALLVKAVDRIRR